MLIASVARTAGMRGLHLVESLDGLLRAHGVVHVVWDVVAADDRVTYVAHVPADCAPELQAAVKALETEAAQRRLLGGR